ncbi:MAG TPA: site-specific DNA-methyltransferase [Blastocatellia bacterium]|nr:site-specific DNA-methyltransferase [Blastocatellia bacterium]
MTRTEKESKKQVDSIKHKDKRANIPTEELRDFVAEDESAPKTMLYPRDPSLDPQLVWKGKDEQDASDLAVPVVPIYIQEKIHPQVLIEDLRAHSTKAGAGVAERWTAYQASLFADFNGMEDDFEKKVDFYSHESDSQPHWSNRMILGDSLLVMTSLAEKEGLKGKVQMIYIDPPYGIKFGSNWQVSTRKRDVKDGKAEDATRQPEQIRAFRDTWKLGIHSYLSYLRDRLYTALELLTESGSIFVQIGSENVHLIRCLLDEVFGSQNFCALITFKKTGASTEDLLPTGDDYVLWYGKQKTVIKFRPSYKLREVGDLGTEEYKFGLWTDGSTRNLSEEEMAGIKPLSDGERTFRFTTLTSSHHYALGEGPVEFEGRTFMPGARYWTTSPQGVKRLAKAQRLVARNRELAYRRFLDDFPVLPLTSNWTDTMMSSRSEDKIYVVQSSVKVISRCLLMTTDPGDLVFDPTCGSGTTALVAEQWGRRWITADTSRVALALARTRLMAAKYPYYFLADSVDGVQKEAEATSRIAPEYKTEDDIKKGFVYKRVPHITLKAIANNEEIDVMHERWQPKQDTTREKLNKALKKNWEEWEVPREADDKWSQQAKTAHSEFWRLRRERQREIDASIAKRADTELLYDQPYEDNKRIRVSGPFTVESLSPHRVLAADENMDSTVSQEEARRTQDFASMILDNLKKAGVQNTRKNERLVFETLDTHGGAWINAAGTFTDSDGKLKRVAVSIGPEHGTVGPQQVKEAAKEAVQGIGFDLLVVCGFAFDPHVAEEAKRYGKLTVLPARMNPDLAMGDELLKKTGAGNLFMVFGEPDVDVHDQKDGTITVEIKGLDIYDPTTGEIRSSSTDDLACWFIDTDYNGESFFVRHAYFTGADEPYEKLKRALRAEIDEGAWSSLYQTVSRPFSRPKTGKIAVKVINHYGDEVLKVFEA